MQNIAAEAYEYNDFDGVKADFFSAGVTLFKMFFNKSPFYTADYKVYDRLAPYIMNEKEWTEGMLQPYDVEFAMPENLISSIIKKNASSFAIIFHDSSDRVCYRKDIKNVNFPSYNTKITKIKGNMTNKPTRISVSTFFKNQDSYPNQQIRTLKVIK